MFWINNIQQSLANCKGYIPEDTAAEGIMGNGDLWGTDATVNIHQILSCLFFHKTQKIELMVTVVNDLNLRISTHPRTPVTFTQRDRDNNTGSRLQTFNNCYELTTEARTDLLAVHW